MRCRALLGSALLAAALLGASGLAALPGLADEGALDAGQSPPRNLALNFLQAGARGGEPAIAHLAVDHGVSAASFARARPVVDDTTSVRDAVQSRRVKDAMPGVQRALKALGFASVVLDGRQSQEFRNVLCAWREAVGEEPSRERLTAEESRRIVSMTALPHPRGYMVEGLNVNLQCQSTAWVVDEGKEGPRYQRVFRVSTGAAGLSTSPGHHVIQRRLDGLHNSSSYPSPDGWNMYRPSYFTSWGEAFHGGVSSSAVLWYPASHGCVRMLHPDIDYLWRKGGNAIGTSVYVYGAWQG